MDKKSTLALTGKILIATPSLSDPRFHRAVILICGHDESGAMGLVINHPLAEFTFHEFLEQLGISSDIKVERKTSGIPVMGGGPVEEQRGFILHSSDFVQSDTVPVGPQICVTGTVDALKSIARGQGPQDMMFVLGYAGWGAGQLNDELQQNAWLVVDADPDLIFHVPHDEKWARSLKKIGVDPALLSPQAGQA